MASEMRDQVGYRIAVATIGIALIVALAGLCVIVAVGQGAEIPKELWSTVSALGGGLLGLLAPSPTSSSAKGKGAQNQGGVDHKGVQDQGGTSGERSLWKDVKSNLSVVILLLVFASAVLAGALSGSAQYQALAAASGAALIGLLAPSPAKHGGAPTG